MSSARTFPITASAACRLVTAAGLVTAVVGTFLPWFVSGAVTRDSYEAVGLIGALGLAGDAQPVLELWAAVPLLCAGSAALLLTRFTRTAAVACWIPAIPVGTVSVLLTVQAFDRDGPVGIAAPGPVVTATGTAVAAVAAVGVLASAHLRKGAR